jgi:hypothetical protein
MTGSCVVFERSEWSSGSIKVAGERDGADESALRATLIETIRLARQGAWSEAEQGLHAALSAVAPEALSHVYIMCVELMPTLLSESARREGSVVETSRTGRTTVELARPRVRLGTDPALNYTHAILTALRFRLVAAEPPRARQAS